MSNVWKMIRETKGNCKAHAKKAQAFFGSQSKILRFQTCFKNPKDPRNVIGFSKREQTFTPLNYFS